MKIFRLALASLLLTGLAACSKSSSPSEKHVGHTHTAPHGGTLIEIGEHAYNLELLRDKAAGKLTAWVLDGHAENFVRLNLDSFQLIAMPGGQYTPLDMRAVANPATGETVGDTSQFEVEADFLKTAGAFSGIFTLEIKGTRYHQVAYSLPE